MWGDADAVVEVFGKSEWVMRVCWKVSIAIVGLVITNVLDPTGAQLVVGVITGIGGENSILKNSSNHFGFFFKPPNRFFH